MTSEASDGKSGINASNLNNGVALTNSTSSVTVSTEEEVEAVVEMAPAAAAKDDSTPTVVSGAEDGDKKNFLCGVIEGKLARLLDC